MTWKCYTLNSSIFNLNPSKQDLQNGESATTISIQLLCQKLFPTLSYDMIREVIRESDASKNGLIEFEEFVKVNLNFTNRFMKS